MIYAKLRIIRNTDSEVDENITAPSNDIILPSSSSNILFKGECYGFTSGIVCCSYHTRKCFSCHHSLSNTSTSHTCFHNIGFMPAEVICDIKDYLCIEPHLSWYSQRLFFETKNCELSYSPIHKRIASHIQTYYDPQKCYECEDDHCKHYTQPSPVHINLVRRNILYIHF